MVDVTDTRPVPSATAVEPTVTVGDAGLKTTYTCPDVVPFSSLPLALKIKSSMPSLFKLPLPIPTPSWSLSASPKNDAAATLDIPVLVVKPLDVALKVKMLELVAKKDQRCVIL